MSKAPSTSTVIQEILPDLYRRKVLVIGTGAVGAGVVNLARSVGMNVAAANRSLHRLEDLRSSMPDLEIFQVNARQQGAIDKLLNAVSADHIVLATGRVMGTAASTLELGAVMDYLGDRLEPILAAANWIANATCKPKSLTIVAGFIGVPTMGNLAWSAAGPAIKGLMEHLAVELGPTRVNVVAPGPLVDTPMAFAAAGDQVGVRRMTEALEKQLPIGRVVHAIDAARQVLHVMGDPVVTGSMRFVEGGLALAPGSVLRDLHLDRPEH